MKQTTIKKIKERVKYVYGLMMATVISIQLNTQYVHADPDENQQSADFVIEPINALVGLMVAIVVARGGYLLVIGANEWSESHRSNDVPGEKQAFRTIISGVLCVGISGVLAYLGFTV